MFEQPPTAFGDFPTPDDERLPFEELEIPSEEEIEPAARGTTSGALQADVEAQTTQGEEELPQSVHVKAEEEQKEQPQPVQQVEEVSMKLVEEAPRLVHKDDEGKVQDESEEPAESVRKKRRVQSVASYATPSSRPSTSRPSTSRDYSKITPFLPNTHMWEWASGFHRHRGKKYFRAIQSGEETIHLGDDVLFISDAKKSIKPYIGKIQTFWEAQNSKKWVRVHWFYHPDEMDPPRSLEIPVKYFSLLYIYIYYT